MGFKVRKCTVSVPDSGPKDTAGQILCHVIAHEIHHVGQLSIWARQIGREPVSTNLVGRRLT
ncbi:MAG: hypothetical protein K6T81_18420 [Alicyclobacillus macrosporangiidus]|nr:hypothetical protein [Alicyclobacillus macrosporangiidus]